jgi:hypothetical protein
MTATLRTAPARHISRGDGALFKTVHQSRTVSRTPDSPKFGNWYGTTFRYFDLGPRSAVLFNPDDGVRAELIGCRRKRNRARGIFGRHADPLTFSNYARLVCRARRTAGSRWQNMATPVEFRARASEL